MLFLRLLSLTFNSCERNHLLNLFLLLSEFTFSNMPLNLSVCFMFNIFNQILQLFRLVNHLLLWFFVYTYTCQAHHTIVLSSFISFMFSCISFFLTVLINMIWTQKLSTLLFLRNRKQLSIVLMHQTFILFFILLVIKGLRTIS